MTSEIRANTLKNRVGLGTVSFTNTGPIVSGIVTIANSTAAGVRLEDNAGVGNSLKITTPSGYVSIGAGNATFVHLNTDRGVFYFQRRIFVDEGIIGSYDEDLKLQSPSNTNRVTINKDTGLVSILNDLDVDGHTNLDNVSIAGVTTHQDDVAIRSSNPLILSNAANNASCQVLCDGGARLHFKSYNQTMATFENGQAIVFYTDSGQNRLQINNNGNILIAKDLDVDGHTNLDNVSIAGVSTFASNVDIDGNTTFGANGSITSSADFHLSSNSLRVTGGSTVVGEFKGATIPTIQVTQTTNNTDLQLRANSGGGLIRTATNTALNLGTFQINRIQITNDGKVQIGLPGSSASLPGAVEVVNIRAMTDGNLCVRAIGSIASAPSGSGVGIDVLNDANNTVKDLALRGSTIIFRNASNESARIDSNGNLMIGRTSASKKFSIEEPGGSSGVHYLAQIGGSNHVSGYAVGIAFDPEGYQARTKMALVAEGTSQGYSRGKFHFLLDAANDSGEATLSESRMTITDAGNIGISRTNPSYRLHLHTPPTDTTQFVGLAIANDGSGAGTGGQINMGAANGFESTAACIAGFYDGTGTSFIVKTAGTYANQSTVDTRFRISNDGRVTMGSVDPSSSSALHIRSNTTAETTLELSTKSNYNGSLPSAKISFTQQNGTEIARIKCDTNTGAANMADLVFWTNYGGLYERMRISKTGEVGIGRDTSGNINTRGLLEIAAPYTDVTDNDGSADLGTNRHDAIIINTNGASYSNGVNVGSISWITGSRRRACIVGEMQSTDSDYLALAFFTRGSDGPNDFYKSFIIHRSGSADLHGSLSQNTSDDRLKKDKVEITNALDKVNSLSSFTHKWNDIAVRAGLEEDKEEIGLSAQEVQGLYPSLVSVNSVMKDPENPDVDYLTVHYEKVVPLLVASIKELTAKNKALEARLDELENS